MKCVEVESRKNLLLGWRIDLDKVVKTIQTLAADLSMSFQNRTNIVVHLLDAITETEVIDHLEHGGIIPECFGHDSTEEKLYAKYCDILLSKALSVLGMTTEVIEERSDSADVVGTLDDYRIVGDAKAFRLSRTAKNQKDFKVEALSIWRKGAEYAILCAPLYQYPIHSSQIYDQAVRHNVTLVSYTHLAYLIKNKPKGKNSLRKLWELGKTINASKDAYTYWNLLNKTICDITATKNEKWEDTVTILRDMLPAKKEEQVLHLEQERERINKLSHSEAVRELIASRKIDNKILTITKLDFHKN
jgi:hypothetical protein